MDKDEIFWRTGQSLQRLRPADHDQAAITGSWQEALDHFREAGGRPVLLDRRRAREIAARAPGPAAEAVAAAEDTVEGRFTFFGFPTVALRRPIDWHHDPVADVHWPVVPSHRLDPRTVSDDVKWIWELNRLQHLVWLAEAWLFTGESRYSTAAFEHLDTWMDQNPVRRGIAWRGAFEAGLRSISIAVALQGLRDAPELTVGRFERIVGVLAESASRCWRERSRFSSGNNHLIGEMAGLAVVAMLFPELRRSAEWERNAVATLVEESGKQILPDGGGAEQSVAYQMASVELLHLVAAMLYERDGRAPRAMTDAIRRSSEFLAAVVGEADPDPRYGDNDQQFAVRFGAERTRTVRDHLGIVGSLDPAAVIPVSHSLNAQWFRSMGRPAPAQSPAAQQSAGDRSTFFAPDAGLAVLRSGRRRTTMDVGPLGYLSIAAHGHADALAVTVSIDGRDVIGDPGTGSYGLHPGWRPVMRGTRAHPTVCVDGQDQSVIAGPFLWSDHAEVRVRRVDLAAGVVDAQHDGYLRLPGGVVHRRVLVAPPGEDFQLVVDAVVGHGAHEVRTCWPLHPSVAATRTPQGHLLLREERPLLTLLHAATAPLRIDDVYGDEDRDLGWWSERLESRVATWWLGAVCTAGAPVAIATLMAPPDTTADLEVQFSGDSIVVTWREGATPRRVEMDADGSVVVTPAPRGHSDLPSARETE